MYHASKCNNFRNEATCFLPKLKVVFKANRAQDLEGLLGLGTGKRRSEIRENARALYTWRWRIHTESTQGPEPSLSYWASSRLHRHLILNLNFLILNSSSDLSSLHFRECGNTWWFKITNLWQKRNSMCTLAMDPQNTYQIWLKYCSAI